MKEALSLLLSILFFGLASLHFFWALGGQWGFENALPTNEHGLKILNPSKIDSLIVGIGLLFFGLFYLISINLIQIEIPVWIMKIVLWVIPAIFLLRAMGDFKYIGFTKQLKTSEFANLDTFYYSPLCLIIGLLCLVVLKLK